MAHAASLNQALLTLLEAAIDRSKDDGVLEVVLAEEEGEVVLTILDQAEALSSEASAGLFEIKMGQRGGRVGMQVGMSLAKRTIDELEGLLAG